MSDQEPLAPSDPFKATPRDESGASSEIPTRTVLQDTNVQPEIQEAQTDEGLAAGAILGPYELIRKLGQGGMGAVYEARHTKLSKTFALKVLPPGFASAEGALTRFEREMRAIGQLDHPHIVKATDADEWQGTHYLVMEYVEGMDLAVLVKTRGPLPVRDACKAIRQAAMGLQHAHEHGLVHRDIKPSNLFVTKTGQIKILDLGLARLGDDGEHQRGLTTIGQILGTPDYMAPEQWDDTHSVDARADLYSLGCTLCFVLTGRAPYADVTRSSLLQLMKAHVEGAIPDLTETRLDTPFELNAIFTRLMAKEPGDRYSNAAEVVAALEPFTHRGADGSPLTAQPVFAPGREPPTAHRVPGTSKGHAGRGVNRSGQQSIKSLSAASTESAFASDRPVIREGNSTSPRKRVAQSRVTSSLSRRWQLIMGLSGLSLAAVIGITLYSRLNTVGDPPQRESSAVERSTDDESVRKTASPGAPTNADGWQGWPVNAPQPAIAPFDTEEARKHQEAWATYMKVPVEWENSIGMKFRLIPPGEFLMGGIPAEVAESAEKRLKDYAGEEFSQYMRSELPQHRTILTQPFYIGIHELTQQEYETVMHVNPSFFSAGGKEHAKVEGLDTSRFPVEGLSWDHTADFCNKLSQNENFEPRYFHEGPVVAVLSERTGYRMPSEAEWEFACRAGTTTVFWSGDREADVSAVAWFNVNAGKRTHAVGQLAPNPFGLYDFHGNVWEWVEDGFHSDWYARFEKDPAVNPLAPFGGDGERVNRDGQYSWPALNSASSRRHSSRPTERASFLGCRIALPVDSVRLAVKRQDGQST